MSSSIFGFGFLLTLPVLIAYWVGVISLGKSGRNGAWWCMMVGTALSTLSMMGSLVWMVTMAAGAGARMGPMEAMIVVSGIGGFGSLLFAIGFAMHGLRSRRVLERMEELERVLEAQQEQLSRQEGQG